MKYSNDMISVVRSELLKIVMEQEDISACFGLDGKRNKVVEACFLRFRTTLGEDIHG